MYSLSEIIRCTIEQKYCPSRWTPTTDEYNRDSLLMIVPINKDIFEIPIFILSYFENLSTNVNNDYDTLVVQLKSYGHKTSFASIDSNIRQALSKDFGDNSKLVKVVSKNSGTVYYITEGAFFDSNFRPIALLSWQFKKVIENNVIYYKCVRPIFQIIPEVIINKADDIQRYISNKYVTDCLELHSLIKEPLKHLEASSAIIYDFDKTHSVKIEIDNIPFEIYRPDSPSISTTNKELLEAVIPYLDELPEK